jgi:hypothetical protein
LFEAMSKTNRGPTVHLVHARARVARRRWSRFSRRHHLAIEVGSFLVGFFLDVFFTRRIDSRGVLVHQAVSLAACVLLVAWDHRLTVRPEPPGWLGRLARRRQWLMHVMLGGLLNVFLVFFFRSSGDGLALGFVFLLLGLAVLNETPRFRARGPLVRVALLSFATTAFLMYLLPIVSGALHRWQPLAAVSLGSLLTLGLWRLFRWLTADAGLTFRRAALPGLAIQGLLLAMVWWDLVPPVPISLKHIGIYTSVRPAPSGEAMRFFLTWQPAEAWEFWRDDARTLVAERGQKAWVYARVFAPMAFDDEVTLRWELQGANGWQAVGEPQVWRKGFASSPAARWRSRVATGFECSPKMAVRLVGECSRSKWGSRRRAARGSIETSRRQGTGHRCGEVKPAH